MCMCIPSSLTPGFCSWSLKVVTEKLGSQLTVIAMILRGDGCLEEKEQAVAMLIVRSANLGSKVASRASLFRDQRSVILRLTASPTTAHGDRRPQ